MNVVHRLLDEDQIVDPVWAAAKGIHKKLRTQRGDGRMAVVADDAGTLRVLRVQELQFELDQHIITESRVVGFYDARVTIEMLVEDIKMMPIRRRRGFV